MNSKYIETINTLINKVREEKELPQNIDYFIKLIERRHLNFQPSENDVAVFNTIIPEEIIRAMDLNPVWCLGGSLDLGDNLSDNFPRDVDPVVLASYGLFMQHKMPAVIAFQNDSYRKLSWLLQEHEYEVLEIDLPAVREMESSYSIYNETIMSFIDKLEKNHKRKLVSYKIYKNYNDIQQARMLMKELLDSQSNNGIFSSLMIHFVLSSYYCAKDLVEYSRNLKLVINENIVSEKRTISLGIVGSPLFFPNNKIFKITQDLGVNIDFTYNENNMFLNGYNLADSQDPKEMVSSITEYYYKYNLIPHNITEEVHYNSKLNHLDGVIFHILKGQISYDYDYIKLEESINIPIIRLETDYNKEDVEQIKIRLEAFVEMVSSLKVN
jgi:benzoyl-CoA reductase/2-hydroxyglutaryl-CoA dehydratase subunit BcrC/BadD/HgdB